MKTLKNAGIAIILSLIIGAISLSVIAVKIASQPESLLDTKVMQTIITQTFPAPLLFLTTALSIALTIFIFLGFIKLSKITKNKKIKIAGWTLMIVLIFSSVKEAIFNYLLYYQNIQSIGLIITQAILSILTLLAIVIFYIILGIGLVKINNKVQLAKVAGILYIISAATMIVFVGAVLLVVAQIIAVALFFKASKKFEK